MTRHEKCPACDSTNIRLVFDCTDHTVSAQKFGIWQCAHCSLRFTQDIPPPNEIGKYYKSENYISHTETNKGIINWLYLHVRTFTLALKRRFIENETGMKQGALLDIGAGAGAFTNYMHQHGWNVEGVEPDKSAIERASQQYGLSLRSSSDLFSLAHHSFDVITMWHVLEHVHELHEYIDQAIQLLKANGRLFIGVPNYTSFDADHYGQAWAAYDVPRHLYHFSPAAMQDLMHRHKCVIEKMQPMWFDSFYVSMLSEKYKTGRASIIKGFWFGLKSNFKALSNKRKASSIIYVVKTADHVPA